MRLRRRHFSQPRRLAAEFVKLSEHVLLERAPHVVRRSRTLGLHPDLNQLAALPHAIAEPSQVGHALRPHSRVFADPPRSKQPRHLSNR